MSVSPSLKAVGHLCVSLKMPVFEIISMLDHIKK